MFAAVLTFVVCWNLSSFAASQCPHGWVQFQSSCYGFGDDDVTWDGAEEFCQLFESSLAEVETSEENEFLKGAAINRQYDSLWLGGTDVFSEDYWFWAGSKDPFDFTDWHAGEPNSYNGAEHCLLLLRTENFQWNDASCNFLTKFVCEIRLEEEGVV